MRKHAIILASVATLGLAACEEPAGSMANEDSFASSIAQNLFMQSGFGDARSYLQGMSAQFRAQVPTMINFAFDSTRLDAESMRILDRQAEWIIARPAVRFRVYGHTDLVGTEAYNQGLGMRRARAAIAYLIRKGVPRSQLEAAVSLGESAPLVDTQERERLNRRTVTDVAGFNPRFLDGEFDGKRAVIVYGEYFTNTGSEIVSGGGL